MRKRPYQDLIVWQEAHHLCTHIYAVTNTFPQHERYGLINQIRRASYSVSTNIAEGNGRRSLKEKRHFLDIAIGSLEEVHYQTLLAYELHYIDEKECINIDDMIQRTGYLLGRLRKSFL